MNICLVSLVYCIIKIVEYCYLMVIVWGFKCDFCLKVCYGSDFYERDICMNICMVRREFRN